MAYHSGTQYEAQFRGLTEALQQFTCEHSALADALDYCDMTTGPVGERLTFEQRIADIFRRYDETHIVNQAMHQAVPSLSLSVERTKQALQISYH